MRSRTRCDDVGSRGAAKAAVELGRRLLAIHGDPYVWAWTADWWDLFAFDEDVEGPPYWIIDAGRALVDDGSVARAPSSSSLWRESVTERLAAGRPRAVSSRWVVIGLRALITDPSGAGG